MAHRAGGQGAAFASASRELRKFEGSTTLPTAANDPKRTSDGERCWTGVSGDDLLDLRSSPGFRL